MSNHFIAAEVALSRRSVNPQVSRSSVRLTHPRHNSSQAAEQSGLLGPVAIHYTPCSAVLLSLAQSLASLHLLSAPQGSRIFNTAPCSKQTQTRCWRATRSRCSASRCACSGTQPVLQRQLGNGPPRCCAKAPWDRRVLICHGLYLQVLPCAKRFVHDWSGAGVHQSDVAIEVSSRRLMKLTHGLPSSARYRMPLRAPHREGAASLPSHLRIRRRCLPRLEAGGVAESTTGLSCERSNIYACSICGFSAAPNANSGTCDFETWQYSSVFISYLVHAHGQGAGCPRGERCGFAHNVFEQWLHPDRYAMWWSGSQFCSLTMT